MNPPLSARQCDRLHDIYRGEVWDDDGDIVWCPSIPGRNTRLVGDSVEPLIERGLAERSDVVEADGRRQVRLATAGVDVLRAWEVAACGR